MSINRLNANQNIGSLITPISASISPNAQHRGSQDQHGQDDAQPGAGLRCYLPAPRAMPAFAQNIASSSDLIASESSWPSSSSTASCRAAPLQTART